MSNLHDREESPRRRISGSRMHPGWACFMCALGAGFFLGLAVTVAAVQAAGNQNMQVPFVLVGISLALFIAGGRKAEKLTDRG